MKEHPTNKKIEERVYHYSNGSISFCFMQDCDEPHYDIDEAMEQLTVDATQGLYRPTSTREVQA